MHTKYNRIQVHTILIDLLKVTFHLPQLIYPETLPFRMRYVHPDRALFINLSVP